MYVFWKQHEQQPTEMPTSPKATGHRTAKAFFSPKYDLEAQNAASTCGQSKKGEKRFSVPSQHPISLQNYASETINRRDEHNHLNQTRNDN